MLRMLRPELNPGELEELIVNLKLDAPAGVTLAAFTAAIIEALPVTDEERVPPAGKARTQSPVDTTTTKVVPLAEPPARVLPHASSQP